MPLNRLYFLQSQNKSSIEIDQYLKNNTVEGAYIDLNYNYLRLDKYQEALEMINKALEINPDRTESIELKKFTLQTIESQKNK